MMQRETGIQAQGGGYGPPPGGYGPPGGAPGGYGAPPGMPGAPMGPPGGAPLAPPGGGMPPGMGMGGGAPPDLEAHVKGIERKIAEQVERTKLATLLYNEATVLRKQGKIEAALEKYRRSVELMPNKRAEDIIAALEKDVAKMNERRAREEALRNRKQSPAK